jgi:hypothetical protein
MKTNCSGVLRGWGYCLYKKGHLKKKFNTRRIAAMSSSDDGYNSDENATVANMVTRNVRAGNRDITRYCMIYSYIRLGNTQNVCMACYSTVRFGTPEDVEYHTHFTAGLGGNLRNHIRCVACEESLFSITTQNACLYCNRI